MVSRIKHTSYEKFINVFVDIDLAKHLHVSHDNKVLSVTLDDALPEETLKGRSYLSFTINVAAAGTSDTASAVLNFNLIGW